MIAKIKNDWVRRVLLSGAWVFVLPVVFILTGVLILVTTVMDGKEAAVRDLRLLTGDIGYDIRKAWRGQ